MRKEFDMSIPPNLSLSWKSVWIFTHAQSQRPGHPGLSVHRDGSVWGILFPAVFTSSSGSEKKARQSTGHGAGKRAATFPTVASRGTVRKYDSRTQIALHGSRDFFCLWTWFVHQSNWTALKLRGGGERRRGEADIPLLWARLHSFQTWIKTSYLLELFHFCLLLWGRIFIIIILAC